MRIDVFTLFPRMFGPVLGESMLAVAEEKGLVAYRVHDIRNFTYDRHHQVDDRPYGGGPGMVMKPEPIFRAVESVPVQPQSTIRRILLSPQGVPFTQAKARELSRADHLILVAGHYEGVDERVLDGLGLEEISIGDYVLTGGEIPAMVVIDAVVRLVPGVLGDDLSSEIESFSRGLLDHPHYTRPPVFRDMRVPEVLLSGDHEKIRRWRAEEAARRTRAKRPDLLPRSELSEETKDGPAADAR